MNYWLSCCIGNARMDGEYNKPVVVQEFGWYGGGESRFLGPLPYRSEADHAEYTRRLCEALIPHVNGFLNWPTFDMPAANDISNHGGIFAHDGTLKELTRTYRELSRKTKWQTAAAKVRYAGAAILIARPVHLPHVPGSHVG